MSQCFNIVLFVDNLGDSSTKIGEIFDWKTRLQIALNASLG
jgi:hypothetical protein